MTNKLLLATLYSIKMLHTFYYYTAGEKETSDILFSSIFPVEKIKIIN